MYVNFDNQLLSLYLYQRIRRSIPLLAIFIIIITYYTSQTIRNNRLANEEANSSSSSTTTNTPSTSSTSTSSSISYTYLGPTSACSAWQRVLDDEGYRADTISSDAISDSYGDWYFSDSVTSIIQQQENNNDIGSIRLNFRFRKLSVLGVEVTSAPLFGQPPALLSDINFTTWVTNNIQDNDTNESTTVSQRLFVLMAVHEPSSTTIVIQNGLYNASNTYFSSSYRTPLRGSEPTPSISNLYGPLNSGIFFSTIALHSNIDGFCLWGHSFLSSDTDNITYTCNTIDTGSYSLEFVPFSLVASNQVFPVEGNTDMCYSWVYLLGTSNNSPQLDGFQLVFACNSNYGNNEGIQPILQHIWSSLPIDCDGSNGILCSDWNTGYGVMITSLIFWNTALLPDTVPLVPSTTGSILFAAYPLVALDPWPNVTDILILNSNQPLTELIAINTTNDSEIWKLSTDIRSNIPIVAIVSNLVVSNTGIIYFAAVKNTTDSEGNVQWERILVSIDGKTGSVLWISSNNIFIPSSFLNPGDELELLSLSLTSTALVYCGLRPSNSTDNGNFGLGAVDIAGGALLWRDTLDYNYAYPPAESNQRNWNPVRIAYCASNLLTDDKYIYTVIGRRPQLQQESSNPSISSVYPSSLRELAPLQYAVYARAVATGDVLWEYTIGDASSVDGSAGGGINVPMNGTAGDYWSALQPFDIAPAPGRRLLMKYDSLILSSSVSASLSLSMDYGAIISSPSTSIRGDSRNSINIPQVTLPTSGISLLSFRCPTRPVNGFEYIYVSISVVLSIFIVRCIGGCIWSTITVHSYNINELTSKALRKAADQALRQMMYQRQTIDSNSNSNNMYTDQVSKDNSRASTSSTYQNSSKGHRSSRGSTDSSKERGKLSRSNSRSSVGSSNVSARNSRKNSLSGINENSQTDKRKHRNSKDLSPSSSSSSSVSSTSSSSDSIDNHGQVPSVSQRKIPRSKDRKHSRRNSKGTGTTDTVIKTVNKGEEIVQRSDNSKIEKGSTRQEYSGKTGRRKPLGPTVAFGTGTLSDTSNKTNDNHYDPNSLSSMNPYQDDDLDFDIDNEIDNDNVDPSIYDDLDKLCMVSVCSTGMDSNSSSSSSASASVLGKQNKYLNSLPISIRNYLTSRYFCRSGNPWVLLSVIHYITVLTALYLSVQESVTMINQLQTSLANPLQFYSQYLINRSPSTTALCRSQAAAACYCTDTNPLTSIINASCFTNGVTCDFDVTECSRSCDTVLRETGNCAASVFSYSCGCGPDCSSTQFYPNTSLSIKGYGRSSNNDNNVPLYGLPAGLAMCSSHYAILSWVLLATIAGYTICAVIAIWVHLDLGNPFAYGCKRKRTDMSVNNNTSPYRSSLVNNSDKYGINIPSSPMTNWRNRMTNSLRELAGYSSVNDLQSSEVGKESFESRQQTLLEKDNDTLTNENYMVRQMFPPQATEGNFEIPSQLNNISGSNSYETGEDNVFAVMASPTTRSKYQNNKNTVTTTMVQPIPLVFPTNDIPSTMVPPTAYYDNGKNNNNNNNINDGMSTNMMNTKRRSPLFVLPQPTKGTYVVTHVVFIVACQLGILLMSFFWTSFLISQGRYCTGADGQTTGTGIPFIGDQILPSKSLILRYVPGCAFGASWQDADYEGGVLVAVNRCILVQVFAILLLGLDQIIHLLHVCLHRCNSILKLRKQQLYYSGKNIKVYSSSLVPPFCSLTGCWSWCFGGVTMLQENNNASKTTTTTSLPSSFFKFIDINKVWVPEAWLSPDTFPRRIFCCSRYIPSTVVDGRSGSSSSNGFISSDGLHSSTVKTKSTTTAGTMNYPSGNRGSFSGQDKYDTNNGYTLTPTALLDHEEVTNTLYPSNALLTLDDRNSNNENTNVYGCIMHTPCIEIRCGVPEKI